MIQRFFFLKQQNRIFGPFAAAQLLQMYRAGDISHGDQVSPDKLNWVNAISFLTGKAPQSPLSSAHVLPLDVDCISTKNDINNTGRKSNAETNAKIALNQTTEKTGENHVANRKATLGLFCRIMGLLFLLTSLCSGGIYLFLHGLPFEVPLFKTVSDTATLESIKKDWQSVIHENKASIGVVVLDITQPNGQQRSIPMGTAWANSSNSFVTNAHVVLWSYGYKKKNPKLLSAEIHVAMNGSSKRHLIESIQIHPDYFTDREDSDFAVLYTNDTLQTSLSCASKKELKNIQQGEEIMYLGFPMEGLHQQNLNLQCPMATMQKGSITSISDFSYGDSGFEKNTLIRHSLPTVGGVSGSPLFSQSGKVIAILFAGNMDFKSQQDRQTGKVTTTREASAAMVNFAIRIDRLEQCLKNNMISATDFLEGK